MFVSEINKKNFRSILLLDELIANNRQFKTMADGDDKYLEPFFVDLMSKDYVTTAGMYYVPTAKGKETYEKFNKRFQEYLRLFDIYAFVDLNTGEFAFSKFFEFDADEDWEDYAFDDRFEDLRIAVAIFKKMDPAEIVFMSFINEKRIDTEATGWQMDLSSDVLWQEIEDICENALKPDQLGEPDVIEDIVRKGTALMIDLLKEEHKLRKEEEEEQRALGELQNGHTVVEEYETVEYYEPYYDPWYVSPFWLVPLFLW
jgi:hypothetical protein